MRLVLFPQPLRVPLPDKVRGAVPVVLPVTTILPERVTVEQLIAIVNVPVPVKVPSVLSDPLAVIVVVNVEGQHA